MKKIIRKGVFESNSSSSHSISIMNEPQEWTLPRVLHFRIHTFHNFPEDDDWMGEVSGRANYIYSIATARELREEFIERVKTLLKDKNIKLIFDNEPKWWQDEYETTQWDCRWDLINHQAYDVSNKLFNAVMEDDTLLMNYLFDDKTDIEICGDWMIQGVEDGEDRWIAGYGRKQVEEWDNEW